VGSKWKAEIALKSLNNLKINFPSFHSHYFCECEFGAEKILKYISFDDFLFLYLSIIQEKNLIFIS